MTPEQIKALRERLGLPDGTSDEAVYGALLALSGPVGQQLGEPPAAPPVPPVATPPAAPPQQLADQVPPAPPEVDIKNPELVKLAETNPAVKQLVDVIAAQEKALSTNSEALKLAEVNRAVDGLKDKAKLKGYSLAPAIAEELQEVLMLCENKKLSEKIQGVLDKLIDTGFVFVRLGELGSGHNIDTDDAISQYTREVKKLTDKGMAYGDAVNQVSVNNPELFTAYREASYSFREQ